MRDSAAFFGYPTPRERGAPVGAPHSRVFEGYDSTNGEVTLADTDADVLVLAGNAQKFILTARTNGALVTITDRMRGEDKAITVLAGQPERVHVTGDVVRARNLVAGSNAALSVAAFYDISDPSWRRPTTA